MTLTNIKAHDGGQYECEANNGLGKPLKKSITLTVHGKVVRNIHSYQECIIFIEALFKCIEYFNKEFLTKCKLFILFFLFWLRWDTLYSIYVN